MEKERREVLMKMTEKKGSRKGGVGGWRGKWRRQEETRTGGEKHHRKYVITKKNEEKQKRYEELPFPSLFFSSWKIGCDSLLFSVSMISATTADKEKKDNENNQVEGMIQGQD